MRCVGVRHGDEMCRHWAQCASFVTALSSSAILAYNLSLRFGQTVGAIPFQGYCSGRSPWYVDACACPHAPSGCRYTPPSQGTNLSSSTDSFQTVSDFYQIVRLSPFAGSRMIEWPIAAMLLTLLSAIASVVVCAYFQSIILSMFKTRTNSCKTRLPPRVSRPCWVIFGKLFLVVELLSICLRYSDVVLPPVSMDVEDWEQYDPYMQKSWPYKQR
jgi:hypothetical protein